MPSFRIELETCDRDGRCVKACPSGVIQLDPSTKFPTPTQDYQAHCLVCGHCVAVCPSGAFIMDPVHPDLCAPIDPDLVLTAEQAEQFLRSRRSIRNFKKKPVEREKLEKLIEIACYAPSAKNSQPWHWTVVEDPADVRRFAGMVMDWIRGIVDQFPEIAGDLGYNRVVAAWDSGQERICRGAPHIVIVHADKDYGFGAEDGALALSYLELFAPVLGLGACWGGYFYSAVNAHPPLFEAVGLPDEQRAFGAMMVGYPQLKYQRLPVRNTPRVHWR
jgi:nitroreductase/NAD-dependent dihydropyrimidine dehydrogenase PreA subunit